jgi:peptidoglycan/LPS O-acetylase OafA/YrhL
MIVYGKKVDFMGAEAALVVQVVPLLLFAIAGPRILPNVPDLSYGIYIYHWPILSLLVVHYGITARADILAALFPTLLAVSLVSWYFIEAPALAFGRRLTRPTSTQLALPEVETERLGQ